MEGRIGVDAAVVDGDGEVAVVGEVGAVCVGDAPELVDARDEGAYEAKVDEGDEDGGVAGGLPAEDGQDGPCGCEDGDDEECAVDVVSIIMLSGYDRSTYRM